jgi:DNA modification methylase
MNTSAIDSELAQDAAAGGHWVQRLVLPCGVTLYQGDCLEILPHLSGIDAVISDPPYGTTQNKWDTPLNLTEMWLALPNVPCCLFGAQPFTSRLIQSRQDQFSFCWYWRKNRPTGHLNAGRRPMAAIEEIAVFGAEIYNPQKTKRTAEEMKRLPRKTASTPTDAAHYGRHTRSQWDRDSAEYKMPSNVLDFKVCAIQNGSRNHPTEKPVDLMAYLVKTHTNKGATVIDPFMGSGTTGVACIRTGRNFIGIEKDPEHFETARKRIEAELAQGDLFRQNSNIKESQDSDKKGIEG